MRNDLTAEQLQQPITITLPLGVVLNLAETTQLTPSEAIVGYVHTSTPFNLPAIGAAYEGGIFAGLTIYEGRPMALVLFPGEFNGNWKDATAWAKDQGGVLPSRVDALILWQNLPNEFKKEAYWTGTQHAADSDSAWYQNFDTGLQGSQGITSFGNELRARCVRRLEI